MQFIFSKSVCNPLRAAHRKCLWKKVFLNIFQISQESTCARVSFFNKAAGRPYNFFKKETLVQLFSCEFCESFKASLFTKQLWLLLTFIKPTIHFLTFFLMFINKTCFLLNIFQNLAEKLPGNNYLFEQVLLLVKSLKSLEKV